MFASIFAKILGAMCGFVCVFYLIDITRSFSHNAIIYPMQRIIRTGIFLLMEGLLVLWLAGISFANDREIIKTMMCFFASIVDAAFIVILTIIDIHRVTGEFVVRAKHISGDLRDESDG